MHIITKVKRHKQIVIKDTSCSNDCFLWTIILKACQKFAMFGHILKKLIINGFELFARPNAWRIRAQNIFWENEEIVVIFFLRPFATITRWQFHNKPNARKVYLYLKTYFVVILTKNYSSLVSTSSLVICDKTAVKKHWSFSKIVFLDVETTFRYIFPSSEL